MSPLFVNLFLCGSQSGSRIEHVRNPTHFVQESRRNVYPFDSVSERNPLPSIHDAGPPPRKNPERPDALPTTWEATVRPVTEA